MTTKVISTCACGNFNLQLEFLNTSLPLDRAFCLCNSCRRISGSCGVSNISIPANQAVDISKYQLTAYNRSKIVRFYFCSTCGAHALLKILENGSFRSTTGLWDRTEGIIKWTGCKWVGDTLDGGISVWLKEIEDPDGTRRPLTRWMLRDEPSGPIVPDSNLFTLSRGKEHFGNKEKLGAQCQCGGVKFYITRPNEASKRAKSPFPDLMVPYHTKSSENPQNETWWLRAEDMKFLAGTCTCTSCCKASGFDIQPWAFIPKCNIFQDDGTTLTFNMGTLKTYLSSQGVSREFCSVCGATVFWHCEERPDLIDVSVGLFSPDQGARVESWLDWWTGRVSFEEMSPSRSLVKSLENGLKAWE